MGDNYWSEENLRKLYSQLPTEELMSTMVHDIRNRLNGSAINHLKLLKQDIENPNQKIFQESQEQIIDRVLTYLETINNIMNAALDSQKPASKEN